MAWGLVTTVDDLVVLMALPRAYETVLKSVEMLGLRTGKYLAYTTAQRKADWKDR